MTGDRTGTQEPGQLIANLASRLRTGDETTPGGFLHAPAELNDTGIGSTGQDINELWTNAMAPSPSLGLSLSKTWNLCMIMGPSVHKWIGDVSGHLGNFGGRWLAGKSVFDD
uniref:Uncharacterized protein n=1 Tax=Eutreptiella gymnastica TaxID=73025 RepID=A0A7S1IP93_9EUGL|mmetsp:Transcript_3320/g.5690  ORF Transcript_3320/g.5690 Transcript_3320/m.5690 type:complete len:112 (+) Transcript_3320:943-1278(+)